MKLYGIALFAVVLITGCATTFSGYNDSDAIINSNYHSAIVENGRNTSGNTYIFTANSFGGIKTITTLEKKGYLAMNISLEFTSGQGKIVFIKDNEIIMNYDGPLNKNVDLSDMEDGEYILKMAGNNVKKLNLNIMCSQFHFPDYNELQQ
jgi:hypothetical protein